MDRVTRDLRLDVDWLKRIVVMVCLEVIMFGGGGEVFEDVFMLLFGRVVEVFLV